MDEVVVGLPEPRLRRYVGRYVGYRESVSGPLVRHEAAGAFVVLILGWGAPLDVVDPRAAGRGAYAVDSFVAGPFDGYCETSTTGVGAAVQMLLTPLAARRILAAPLGELANRAVGVDRWPEGWLDRLRARLAEEPTWPGRFALLDATLAARLAGTDPVDPRLVWAWRRLAGAGGPVRVGELAEEVGWSRRHLTVRFHREVGLSPRTTVRLLRFQRTYAVLRRGLAVCDLVPDLVAEEVPPAGSWAHLAVRYGYYDQAHLIRDFREFAGATPAALFPAGSHSSNRG
ncbi:helix-turn-helix domain-containing protein [Micromonospora endolithica]|uniref:AraC family transcriptional regulator n=1 Tax=Micromonospora endolithica TaxID=230091 RepID=A0A3A9ZSV0_9ACTN|nr:AraC family transcriptional regulator [Micromonospora endolithica]RKN51299.1 AraC family transcriptional regulator [Micromonospora endolithica]TWJ20570.1 transcriptional regulator, AraC family [Micromonospora endolithica]